MANRDLSEHFPKVRVERGAELVRVEGLTVPGVLSDISFSLHAGEVLGISGLLGAGRTELARVIAGADRFDEGRMFVDGQVDAIPQSRRGDCARHWPAARGSQGAGVRPGSDRRAQHRPAARTAARADGCAVTPVRRRHGGADHQRSARQGDRDAAVAAPERRQPAEGRARQVAGGSRTHLHLRRADPRCRRRRKVEIYNLMNRLTARGAGIIMISSELPELLGMSDRVLVMHRGRIQAELAREDATEERVLARRWGWRVDQGPPVRHPDRSRAAVRGLWILTPHFLTASNLINVVEQTSINAIVAVGMTFVILSARHRSVRGIDRRACRRGARHLAAERAADGARADAGAGRGGRVRDRQRRVDQLGRSAALHRHARDDEHRARRGAAVHRRTAGLRIRRLVPSAGDRPRRLRARAGHRDGDCLRGRAFRARRGRRSDATSMRSAATKKRRGSPASRSAFTRR